MRLFYYNFMRNLYWIIEDLADFIFGIENTCKFYPSAYWEELYRIEKERNKNV